MVGLVFSSGLVNLLVEHDPELQVYALRAANDGMSSMWTELAGAIPIIENLYEDKSFPEKELAALVLAKIYYHLQAYDESMVFALGAGKLFEIDRAGEFEDTIIAKCVDTYMAISSSTGSTISNPLDGKPVELDRTFSNTANGSANTAASMQSPTTPFSQSTLPSRSLLARESSHEDADTGEAPAGGAGEVPPLPPDLSPTTRKSLNAVIRRIFERCFSEGAYRQVVGIAVEARNLDMLRETIERASTDSGNEKSKGPIGKGEELMDYLLDVCMNIVQERGLRNEILQLILDMLASKNVASPDYFSIAKCIVFLGQHAKASDILKRLVNQEDSQSLATAYQISFDLFDNATQEFLIKVMEQLPKTREAASEFDSANGHATVPNSSENAQESTPLMSGSEDRSGATSSTSIPTRPKETSLSEHEKKAYAAVRAILTGSKSLELNLEFLFRANKSDRQIMAKLRSSLEARNSIFHNAVCFANAFTNSGTTSDWFIRENLDWLQKAVNWSKFSVTASLGTIHRGNIGQGRKLLEPYLRDSTNPGAGSAYSKGGALFGLGLIYTNHGEHVSEYLWEQLKKASEDETVQHGAALGLGVAAMGTASDQYVEDLKSAMWQESAISGQAVGVGMGLVLLGSGNIGHLKDMLTQAQETDHDKTVRGLAIGMALIMFARQEAADVMINGLLDDPDPILRYGGVMTVALAYCGTSSNKAVRKLLHVAVSDVSDDVRRMAVMSLGFVLFRKPNSVPRMVELLAESYNPHVRYGATMALGIACAGTGLEEAVDLLEPMMKDSTDFVRQGSLIALAMIMIQQTEAANPKVVTIRKHLLKVVSDRHEDAMAKFGAALALGIIDAGGRNCTIGLQTQTGNLNISAIVGMTVFTQYWYWFPFAHFLSLSFVPTSVIAVDADLDVPQLKLHCNARPSLFEYPPGMEMKQEEAPEKVKTAVLSTTAQAKRRRIAKEKQQKGDSMDVDQPSGAPSTPKAEKKVEEEEDKMETDEADKKEDVKDGEKTADEAKVKKREREKVGFELENISRVLPAQLRYTSFVEGRYVPVKKPTGGVVLLNDTRPSEPKTLVERQVKKPSSASARQEAPHSTTTVAVNPPQTPAQHSMLEATAILDAVDEDEEDIPEAECPREFDYESDGEGRGED